MEDCDRLTAFSLINAVLLRKQSFHVPSFEKKKMTKNED